MERCTLRWQGAHRATVRAGSRPLSSCLPFLLRFIFLARERGRRWCRVRRSSLTRLPQSSHIPSALGWKFSLSTISRLYGQLTPMIQSGLPAYPRPNRPLKAAFDRSSGPHRLDHVGPRRGHRGAGLSVPAPCSNPRALGDSKRSPSWGLRVRSGGHRLTMGGIRGSPRTFHALASEKKGRDYGGALSWHHACGEREQHPSRSGYGAGQAAVPAASPPGSLPG
jgi:hypothetical protein